MALLKFVDVDGAEAEVEIDDGMSIMEGAVGAGVDGIDADCGGQLSCATCHVYLSEEWVDRIEPMTEEEDALLDFAADRRPTSRLCCQIMVQAEMDGMTIHIPAVQGTA